MRVLSVVLTAGILSAGCQSSSTTPLSESHSAAIKDSLTSFLSTWSEETQQDGWNRLVGRYADDEDFAWVEDGQIRYTSVEAIRAGIDELKASFSGVQTEFIKPSITPLAPGMANITTRFRTTLRREGGPNIRYGGAMTMTALNTGDGWKILQGHTSTERQRR